MTLLLVGSSSELVFVATDRRCARVKPGGRVLYHNDDRNKALGIICSNARLIICWTGLCNVEREPVDQWLFRILDNANAGSLLGIDIIKLIKSQADKDFQSSLRRLRAAKLPPMHEFIFAGWTPDPSGKPSAWVSALTNFRNDHWDPLPEVLTNFRIVHRQVYNRLFPQDYCTLLRCGVADAVDADECSRLLKLLQTKPSDRAIAGRVGAIIRKANKHPSLGKYVSQESRVWVIRPVGNIRGFQWPQPGLVSDTPFIIRGLRLPEIRMAMGKLGKLYKAKDCLANVAYTLDVAKTSITGSLGCVDPECDKVLAKFLDSGEVFTLEFEDGRRLNVAIEGCETINHQRRYKIVVEPGSSFVL